jgi:hypothetical protein
MAATFSKLYIRICNKLDKCLMRRSNISDTIGLMDMWFRDECISSTIKHLEEMKGVAQSA